MGRRRDVAHLGDQLQPFANLREKSREGKFQYFQAKYSNRVIAMNIPRPWRRTPTQTDCEKVRS